MNICYLIDVAPDWMTGGGQTHLTNLVRELKRPGLAEARPGLSLFGGPHSNILIRLCWTMWVIPQVFFYHFFFRRFDLIHAHSIPAMMAGKVLSVILGIPIVVTVHGNSLSLKDGSWRTPRTVLFRFLESFVLTKIHYDAQISVSRDFLKVPNVNKRIVYIPNGVDFNRFKRPDPAVRQGQALSGQITNHQSPITILFVGRKNDPIKGFSILEEAIMIVQKQFPSVRLIVADGSVPSSRLPALYQSSNLLVIPSLSEGFPLTLLEAWASKLPVVATAVGEIPSLIKDDINGFLVPPGGVRALANGVIRALKHKDLVKIGENGYNVAKRHTWKRVARETFLVYRDVLSHRLTH